MPRVQRFRFLALATVLLAPLLGVLSIDLGMGQEAPALTIADGVPFEVTTFATGLDFPSGLAILPDGSLLVGTSVPIDGGYFSSTGRLLRLHDGNGDGRADGPGEVVAAELTGSVTAVAVHDDLVFVTSVSPGRERIQILRANGDWSGPYEPLGQMVFAFHGFAHQSYGLATRQSPDDPAVVKLYFNVGARGNDNGGGFVGIGGLIRTRLPDSSIFMAPISQTDEGIEMGEPMQIATGLRNAMGFGFHPETGDLWITDNGIDGLDDPWISFSADELNVIPADRVGSEIVDFGFPSTYVLYETGETIGADGEPPVLAFLPRDGMESEGVAGIAFSPPAFPSPFDRGIFAGFHGQYDMSGPVNEENPLLYIDLETLDVVTIVPVTAPGIGHLNTLAESEDGLYVADLCAGSSLASSMPCGTIYRIVPID
jgi:glucose/arabinose dehydrogenase